MKCRKQKSNHFAAILAKRWLETEKDYMKTLVTLYDRVLDEAALVLVPMSSLQISEEQVRRERIGYVPVATAILVALALWLLRGKFANSAE